jgi:hypothetical protein
MVEFYEKLMTTNVVPTTAADYTTLVQQLYLAYFGRPADPLGRQNFAEQLAALNAPTTLNGLNSAWKTTFDILNILNRPVTLPHASDMVDADMVTLVGVDPPMHQLPY